MAKKSNQILLREAILSAMTKKKYGDDKHGKLIRDMLNHKYSSDKVNVKKPKNRDDSE